MEEPSHILLILVIVPSSEEDPALIIAEVTEEAGEDYLQRKGDRLR